MTVGKGSLLMASRLRIFLVLGSLGGSQSFDLDPCSSKPGAQSACVGQVGGSAVACWTRSVGVSWACWSAASVPAWAFNAIRANAACQSMTDGLGQRSFGGACTFLPPGPRLAAAALPTLRSWAESYQLAAVTLQQMTLEEKQQILHGIGWDGPTFALLPGYYVGNTLPVPRLGLPSLNMQDAADGFRLYWHDMLDTGTCWPSLLAMAATWDQDAVRDFAVALGEEFAGKGANAILGPSVNVHRVARNGRNFEYISGEDPHLGAKLTTAYVEGVQSQGVFAVVKHFAFNEQETNRNTQSSNVDQKTAWNLYYPPFQAAVDAGVAAFMCSYNKVNGVYACSNGDLLNRDLKQRMGFQGFVQSDWWAAHEMSLGQGLDQEMPGTQNLWSVENLSEQNPQLVDDAARRVLAVMYKFDLPDTTKCAPMNCSAYLRANVTSAAHRSLSGSLAAESVVMLKNSDSVLPLSAANVKTIAIIGSAAAAPVYDPDGQGQGQGDWWRGDYYSGGGSGHVVASGVVTPLDGIRRQAQELGIKVVVPLDSSVAEALNVAYLADVVIVVTGTTAGESRDRESLHLDDGADDLIAAMVKQGKPTVVLMQVPGAIVMPWRDSVAAILVLFFGGEETGNAWASVLFGDRAPTGRLPLMMPESEADTIPPSSSLSVPYTEGLKTSYRNPLFKAAFLFGHGLTYTSFEYGAAEGGNCSVGAPEASEALQCIHLNVSNTGSRPGRTVVQAYVELPPEAGYETPVLRSFQKTGIIMPGSSQHILLSFSARELSFYDPGITGWQLPATVTAHIGESSQDIRQKVLLKVPGGGIIHPAEVPGFLLPAALIVLAIALIAGLVCGLQKRSSQGQGACSAFDSTGSEVEMLPLQH
ncbi:unnamed protein product [Polarella glacialis]|uniref:Probable beta-glucosidase G n=1 Tax=Polarella glacialis TaxID=89957 RepID=A0A813D663_POLGL|nr:unnamed protein product [Polarella glacialis]